MRVLVTGGAGYIGSIVTEQLLLRGDQVVVLDNLNTGHPAAVHPQATFVRADIRDREIVEKTIRTNKIEAVVHMAALSLVGDSVRDPGSYYQNNVVGALALLDSLRACGVGRLVFSSTAAVFGEPTQLPIQEAAATVPTSPYGATKLAIEQALHWYEAYGLRSAVLRYFNAAGASAAYGEDHRPETHLIPRVLQTALHNTPLTVFGDDYPTRDGTCVRDYVHVVDLAMAHLLALDALSDRNLTYNLGCGGEGYTVNEVLTVARAITGREIPVQRGPRRPGDPAVLVASSERIQAELGWKPRLGTLEAMVGSAWEWMQRHPRGYAD